MKYVGSPPMWTTLILGVIGQEICQLGREKHNELYAGKKEPIILKGTQHPGRSATIFKEI